MVWLLKIGICALLPYLITHSIEHTLRFADYFLWPMGKQSDKILTWTKRSLVAMHSKKQFLSNFKLNTKLNFCLKILCSVGEMNGVLLHVQNNRHQK